MSKIIANKYINNRRLSRIQPILTPAELWEKLPAGESAYSTVLTARTTINSILHQNDSRLLIILGPCSVHNEKAVLEYASRLKSIQNQFSDKFFFIMRVYFEKPRTSLGWRGLIVDPNLDGVINIENGLERARKLLIQINEMGIPTATEFLDPLVPQYIADLISWASIGARSAESQIHRELASGLSMPVGFKNATDGNMLSAINAVISARQPHGFMGITADGITAVMHTEGNLDSHIVLRGSNTGGNYNEEIIAETCCQLEKENAEPIVLVDCSHGNSGKNPKKQIDVMKSVINMKMKKDFQYSKNICGVMIESFIQGGAVTIAEANLESNFGTSITDPCLGWDDTVNLLNEAYKQYGGVKNE